MREIVYLGNKHLRRLVEIFVKAVRAAFELQFLDREFHRREGIVDLMRDLPRHGPPRSFALRPRQLLRALFHAVNQNIIPLDQRT